MNITVIGTGYVGLVAGACLAQIGNCVLCIDNDADKIGELRRGRLPIHEPGLDKIVADNVHDGRLSFSTEVAEGVAFGEIILVAVGTPPDEDGSADLNHVLQVARTIGEHLSDYKVIANKSTVPVGTARKIEAEIRSRLQARGADAPFAVVSNPEFLKEGAAVGDFMNPDRIIIGVDDARAERRMRELYRPFGRHHEKIMVMDVASAEFTKYAANAMLATKISFMNEMANLAERLGVDIESVRRGIGSDPRIGYDFIYPGCGYGGSCFPKDVKALIRSAGDSGYRLRIIEAVEEVNERQKRVMMDKITAYFGPSLEGLRFALWGLAFKPETDDMREASSRVLLEAIWAAGGSVTAFDPAASCEASRIYGERADLTLEREDPYRALEGADALVLVTEWNVFRSPDYAKMRENMASAVIFDGRNVFSPDEARRHGFDYFGIGRRRVR